MWQQWKNPLDLRNVVAAVAAAVVAAVVVVGMAVAAVVAVCANNGSGAGQSPQPLQAFRSSSNSLCLKTHQHMKIKED